MTRMNLESESVHVNGCGCRETIGVLVPAAAPKDWRTTFGKRLAALRDTSTGVFERQVEQEIMPAFRDLATFLQTGGITVAEARSAHNLQSFRFGLSAQLFVDVIFDLKGPCEVECYHLMHTGRGASGDEPCSSDIVPLAEASEGWALSRMHAALEDLMAAAERMMNVPIAREAS